MKFSCLDNVWHFKVVKYQNQNFSNGIFFGIIEKDQDNIDNLQKIFTYKNLGNLPIGIIKGDFDKNINELLDQKHNLAPTFFLVDPFGFSIRYETLKRIMSVKNGKSEIFLNFMFNSVQRFLKAPRIEHHIDNLFGCTEWRDIKSNNEAKEKDIIDLFQAQLKGFSKYVFPYRLSFPDKDMTYYYMIHLTNNLEACSIMKDAFAKFNEGKVEYIGRKSDIKQMNIFDTSDYIITACAGYLSGKYNNTSLTYGKILEENIDSTEFLERHFREAIRSLLKNNTIQITQIPPTTSTGRQKKKIDYTDIIRF